MFEKIQTSVEHRGAIWLHILVFIWYFVMKTSWGWRPPWKTVPGGFAVPALGILLRLHKMLIIPKTKYTLCMPLAAIICIRGKNFDHSTQILLRESTDNLSIRCGAANNTTCWYSSVTSQILYKFGYYSQRSMYSSWCADHFHSWNYICSSWTLEIGQSDKIGCEHCCLQLMGCFILLLILISFSN